MFIGHYSAAFVAATSPRAPRLGTLFVAAQLVDLAFFSFVLLGVEHMRLVPGITATNPMDLYDMPWTHSMVGALAWSAGFALLIWLWRRSSVTALIGGAVVFSHWLIDLFVHRPDLTLAGGPPPFGLGLWNYPAIEMPLELILAYGTLAWFVAKTRGPWAPVAALAVAMAAFQAFNWFGPEPKTIVDPPPPSLAILGLLAYVLLALLAWWVSLTRELKVGS
ncbi:MAG: hypothetical protein WC729_10745 [Sphingomonas sp.]|jgi:hypothetical protein|uniref:hypothetical protein n=1 Tax=Sphingomonas sp. TaxID=28214 RepID=UPI00356603B5